MKGPRAKFLNETIADFERNGFALSKEDREVLKEINNEISRLGNKFSKNIATYQDSLILDEKGVKGMPEDYKKTRKTAAGTYRVDMSYPSVTPFLKYAESGKAREQLYKKFQNRASTQNIDVLDSLVMKRTEMAKLLGYDTYAEYRLADRMAKTPNNVWDFENDLIAKIGTKAQADMDELVDIMKADKGALMLRNLRPGIWDTTKTSS